MSDVIGRPSEYDPDFCLEVAQLCANGATDEEIADYLDVSVRTLYRWQNRYPEFCQALRAGKENSDERVVRSLYHRANGFRWTEKQAFKIKEVDYADGKRVRETERIEIVDVEKFVPPDPGAALGWLKNRRPEEWREKTETVATVKVEHTRKLDISTLSDEQLDVLEGVLRATIAQLDAPKVIEHED